MKKLTIWLAALAAALSFNAAGNTDRATIDEAQALVKKAVAFYQKAGKEKALAEFQKQPGAFVDRDLYVTVYDMKGDCLSHINPKMVGKNMIDLRDADGVYLIRDRVEGARKAENGWQSYKFFNPVSKKIEPKRMYWEKYDGILFAAGAYQK